MDWENTLKYLKDMLADLKTDRKDIVNHYRSRRDPDDKEINWYEAYIDRKDCEIMAMENAIGIVQSYPEDFGECTEPAKDIYGLTLRIKRMKHKIESLDCLGCGWEQDCSIYGCAILNEAVATLEQQIAKDWITRYLGR